MERKRIEYPGAFYHVIQRGNNRENIFSSEADKSRYLNNLVELKKKYDFRLLGYVLMDNHYHLLIQAGQDPLHKIIFRQNTFYSRYFNKKHNRSGHLYSDRYKASLIQNESYAIAALRYIHWNPVKAGIISSPEKYKWSSEMCYRSNNNVITDIDLLLNTINQNNRQEAIKQYLRVMNKGANDEGRYSLSKIVGDDGFVESITDNIKKEKEDKKFRRSLDDILQQKCPDEIIFRLIKSGSRKRKLYPYKSNYVRESIDEGYSYEDVGKNIKISSAAVAYYAHKTQ